MTPFQGFHVEYFGFLGRCPRLSHCAALRQTASATRFVSMEQISDNSDELTNPTFAIFYCDPPYVHETRSTTGEYAFEMTEAQHRELLDVLAGIAGKFMLSGYPSDLYRQWEVRHGWNRHDFLIDNKAASGKVKETKTECLWCNF